MSQNIIVQCMSCPDQPGIVANICEFVLGQNANITSLEQHVDDDDQIFFMRITWTYEQKIDLKQIDQDFAEVAKPLNMNFSSFYLNEPCNMALLVSNESHCLYDLLARYRSGAWHVNIPMIISNHETCQPIAEQFNIPFVYCPIVKTDKVGQEKVILDALKQANIDCLVLARYMQILSPHFVAHYPNKIINIHHSFLPAFAGAKPYHRAHNRGVKMIGATSHYVTSELDEGPIIAQDTQMVSHRDDIKTLIKTGQDIEKRVLNKALTAHLEHKVLIHEAKTIIFY